MQKLGKESKDFLLTYIHVVFMLNLTSHLIYYLLCSAFFFYILLVSLLFFYLHFLPSPPTETCVKSTFTLKYN